MVVSFSRILSNYTVLGKGKTLQGIVKNIERASVFGFAGQKIYLFQQIWLLKVKENNEHCVEYKNTNICFTVIRKVLKDTVNDAASLNVSVLGKVELDELAKTTGVIVVHSLCVPKGLHDGTTNKRKQSSQPNLCKELLLITVDFYSDA